VPVKKLTPRSLARAERIREGEVRGEGEATDSERSDAMFWISLGIRPVNRQFPIVSARRETMFPISVGRDPVKRTLFAWKMSRATRRPISVGNCPVKLLPAKYLPGDRVSQRRKKAVRGGSDHWTSGVQAPISVGIVPFKLLLSM